MESVEYKNYNITIDYDDNAESPREWSESPFTMACYHSKYNLGDSKAPSREELEDIIKSDLYIKLPLYLLDHSGLSISTGGFSCSWDSGQVGIIYISLEDANKHFGNYEVEQIEKYMRSEVSTYDDYLTGNVYNYLIEDKDGESVNGGCSGFYGYDHEKSGLLEHAHNDIDCYITAMKLNHANRLKTLIKNKVPLPKRKELLQAVI